MIPASGFMSSQTWKSYKVVTGILVGNLLARDDGIPTRSDSVFRVLPYCWFQPLIVKFQLIVTKASATGFYFLLNFAFSPYRSFMEAILFVKAPCFIKTQVDGMHLLENYGGSMQTDIFIICNTGIERLGVSVGNRC